MQDIGTGRRIAGRYALGERRALLDAVEVWSAVDGTLGREVSVTVFPSAFKRAAAILDAARRSASLNDHRLVRVLDVGASEQMSWLVEESLSESTTIADLVARGPLPPEEARRIAGEVASGLDVAAGRGLHHLHLTPHAVRRTHGGLVKVAGLATAAALEGTQVPDAAEAARVDTVGIVAVMYAAMTTRWPLSTPVAGLEQAPRTYGGVAAPSEIALAVPPDLDAVCRSTLNHDTGARTPGELSARIAPWSATVVRHVAPKARAHRVPAMAGEATQAIPAVPSMMGGGVPGPPDAYNRRDRQAERDARTRREREERRADPAFLNLPEALENQRGPLEAPAPLVGTSPEPEGRYAKLILAAVAALIVVALAFAIPTLQSIFAPAAEAPTAGSVPSGTSPAGAAPSPTTSPTATATGTPLELTGARAFDPEGDGRENNSAAPRAIDGDVETVWDSEGYESGADYGGQKDGVGLVVDLPQASTVHSVTLTLGAPAQDVTVYASRERSLEGATEIGTVSDGSGENTVPATEPIDDVDHVIVWVTRAAPSDDGKFRASIAEVAVS